MEIPRKNKLLQCTRQTFSIISQLSKDKRNRVTDIKRVFNPNYRQASSCLVWDAKHRVSARPERINYFRQTIIRKPTSLSTSFDACPHPRLLITMTGWRAGNRNFVNDRNEPP